jgi:alanyl-tRNA synthetase
MMVSSPTAAGFSANLLRKACVANTIITFHQGGIKETSKVLNVAEMQDKKIALFLESTPFHPIDRHWPDQPADRGTLKMLKNNRSFTVIECENLAVNNETYEVILSKSVPKGEKGLWNFVVGHIVESDDMDPESFIGAEIDAEVDENYRKQLCLQHTASHLIALAMNQATKSFWSKSVISKDSLGSPSFDQEALEATSIFEDRAEDLFRFGTSLKKKFGFKAEELFKNLQKVEDEVNETIKRWIEKPSKVEILAEGKFLHSTRTWQCELPAGIAKMFCGGSHVKDLSAFDSINYKLEVRQDGKDKKIFGTSKAIASANY